MHSNKDPTQPKINKFIFKIIIKNKNATYRQQMRESSPDARIIKVSRRMGFELSKILICRNVGTGVFSGRENEINIIGII